MVNIAVQDLTKKYGKVTALDNISFGVNKNELFGFIGPDGAGKTTLLRILLSLLLPDEGSVQVGEINVLKDIFKLRKIIGYMPGRFSLYEDLSIEENLNFFARVFNTSISENYELIKPIYSQIEKFKDRKAGDLSGGMKQKLALSCALIHKPKLLVLDEPTTGVDAVSRAEFWENLKKIQKKDITIVVSTPYMDEASLCDRVALMQSGKILSINSPENIVNEFKQRLIAVKAENTYQLINDLRKYELSRTVFPFGESVHLTLTTDFPDKQKDLDALANYLKNKQDTEISYITPNIEDCFMELMEN